MNDDDQKSVDRLLQVGELAKLAGVSVRTLHHYQEIGLLTPRSRSVSGYRLYDRSAIIRLQQITSLRTIGMSLAEIQKFLDRDVSPWTSLRMHIFALEEQIENFTSLRDRLKILLKDSESNRPLNQDDILKSLKEINDMSKHFTPEQISEFKRRSEEIDPQEISKTQEQWRMVMKEFQELAASGESKTSEKTVAAAKKALELFSMFSQGNPGVEQGVRAMYQDEGPAQILQQNGMEFDQAGWDLMQQAMTELKTESDNC